MFDIKLLIDNADADAAGGQRFTRVNPISGEPATVAAAAQEQDVDAASDAAARAFPAWAALGPNPRRKLLLAAADGVQARAADFARAMIAETGATAAWAGFNVMLGASMLREAASLTTQVTGQTIPSDRPGCFAYSVRKPAGVVLGIAPWNAPVILGVRAIATALACGNTVILKASEVCPATHRLIGDVMRDTGFPVGVVNVVCNAPADAGAVVGRLIAHPAVRRINFTGSTRVGRIIAEQAGRALKPVILELGGKAPLVVLDDADLDAAVDAAIFGTYMNQGQICMSTERIIVQSPIADAFIERFVARARSLSHGDPRSGDVALGSVIDIETVQRLQHMVDDARAKGARVYEGPAPTGTLMPAIVIADTTPQMAIYAQESFGPIVCIIRAGDDDDAVRLANDSEYGLTSAVFSASLSRALRVADRIDAGMCHINGPTVHDEAQMPFGGMKASGYGRFGGLAGIAEFTDLRWITIDTKPLHYPI